MQFSTRRVRFVYMALKIALLGPGAFSQTLDLPAVQETPLPQELTARLRSSVAAAAWRSRPVADADWADLPVGFDPWSEGGRQKLWQLVHGDPLDISASAPSTTLLDVVDGAIGRYMHELGRISWELERAGRPFDYVDDLARLRPGIGGRGHIALGRIGGLGDVRISFRGTVVHPDGATPAVAVTFYLLPDGAVRPVPARLLVPMAGMEPSFTADLTRATGGRTTRSYGWRPRLLRTRSVLDVLDRGEWRRVGNDISALYRTRQRRLPKEFCDAACSAR